MAMPASGRYVFEDWALTVSEYRDSLLSLKEKQEHRYDTVLRNHGTFGSTKGVLDDCIVCCGDILAGRDDRVPARVFGQEGFCQAKRVDAHGRRLDGEKEIFSIVLTRRGRLFQNLQPR